MSAIVMIFGGHVSGGKCFIFLLAASRRSCCSRGARSRDDRYVRQVYIMIRGVRIANSAPPPVRNFTDGVHERGLCRRPGSGQVPSGRVRSGPCSGIYLKIGLESAEWLSDWIVSSIDVKNAFYVFFYFCHFLTFLTFVLFFERFHYKERRHKCNSNWYSSDIFNYFALSFLGTERTES